ncbi:MAG: hypothetical protein F2892_02240 [Actinobacteria bacterium]|nr:hypothetical protein [Actinomycetota bacterium]
MEQFRACAARSPWARGSGASLGVMRIVALGDSIARGVGDLGSGGDVPAWSGRLAHRLGAAQHSVRARAGARIDDVIHHQLNHPVSQTADIALLSAGGNDLLQRDFRLENFAEGLSAVLTRIRASTATTVMLTLPDYSEAWPLPRRVKAGLRRRIADVNGVLQASAADDVLLIDQAGERLLQGSEMHHPDRVHLSPAGYQALADLTATRLGLPLLHPPLPVDAPPGMCAWQPSFADLRRGLRRLPVLTEMAAATDR